MHTPAPFGVTTPEVLPVDWKLLIPGSHNKENVALAVAALKAYGLTDAEIQAGCETFSGVEGRLQYVKTIDGVEIYNDNNATTPSATVAALSALDQNEEKNIVLIYGEHGKVGIEIFFSREVEDRSERGILDTVFLYIFAIPGFRHLIVPPLCLLVISERPKYRVRSPDRLLSRLQ